jgi:tetratricopeptide (TPR) repeat protein
VALGGLLAIAVGGVVGISERGAEAQKSPTAQKATARAQDALASGRYADAIRDLQAAVRYEPRFALGWYLLASSHRRAGDCDRAVSAYRRYLELRPAESEPHYGIGLCLETVGDRAGALRSFRKYLALEKRPEAHAFLQDAEQRAAALDKDLAAAASVAKTVAPEPAQLVEARRLRTAGHVADAIVVYRTWLASNPKDASPVAARVYADLGAARIVTRDLPGAIEALRAAVRLDPSHAPSWYNLGFALRQSGQAKEAVDAYARYITFEPKDPDPLYGLGTSLATIGRTDEALAVLRAYVTLETRPAELRWVTKVRAEIARLSAGDPPEGDGAGAGGAGGAAGAGAAGAGRAQGAGVRSGAGGAPGGPSPRGGAGGTGVTSGAHGPITAAPVTPRAPAPKP